MVEPSEQVALALPAYAGVMMSQADVRQRLTHITNAKTYLFIRGELLRVRVEKAACDESVYCFRCSR
jgi:hypothetical protein